MGKEDVVRIFEKLIQISDARLLEFAVKSKGERMLMIRSDPKQIKFTPWS